MIGKKSTHIKRWIGSNTTHNLHKAQHRLEFMSKQDCIPVGCVPPACWPYSSMHCAGGVCPGGMSAWGVSAQGVSARGCLSRWDVCPGGGMADPPVNRMRDRWKNITATSLRAVIRVVHLASHAIHTRARSNLKFLVFFFDTETGYSQNRFSGASQSF